MLTYIESTHSNNGSEPLGFDEVIKHDEPIARDEDFLTRYIKNNLAIFNDDLSFLNYLSLKKINAFEHLYKNYQIQEKAALKKNENPADLYAYGGYKLHHFFYNHASASEILNPIFSEYRERLGKALTIANYTYGDESKPIEDQVEVTLYKTLKIIKDPASSLLSFKVKQGNEWVFIDCPKEVSMEFIEHSIKSDFEHRVQFYDHKYELLEFLSKVVLAEMFDCPEFLYQADITPTQKAMSLDQLLDTFTRMISYCPPQCIPKATDNISYIRPHHFALSIRKVYWVLSKMINKDLAYLSRYLVDCPLTLNNHNKLMATLSPLFDQLYTLEKESPNKLLFFLSANRIESNVVSLDSSYSNYGESIKKIDIRDFFNYKNMLLKHHDIECSLFNKVFFDKRCFQHTMNIKISLLKRMLKSEHNYDEYRRLNVSFMIWTYYLAYSKKKNPNNYVLSTLHNLFIWLFDRSFFKDHDYSSQCFRSLLNKVVIMLDLVYEILLIKWQETKKLRAYKEAIRSHDVVGVLDYFKAETIILDRIEIVQFEHISNITPQMTISSLRRHVEEWHEQIQEANIGDLDRASYPHLSPFSLDIDGTTFTLIDNQHDLYHEGKDMRHCVYMFSNQVERGEYLVFRADSEYDRATLGLTTLQREPLIFRFDQIFSHRNTPVEPKTNIDAEDFIRAINNQEKNWFDVTKLTNAVPF